MNKVNEVENTPQNQDIGDNHLTVNDQTNLIQQNKTQDYETIIKENKESQHINVSVQITQDTSTFDLYKGLIFMLISCVFKSLFSILSKISLEKKQDLSSFQLLSFRTYFMMWMNVLVIFFGPVEVFSKNFIPPDKIFRMVLRTIFAIISMSMVIYSLKALHISDVYSVYYLYPGLVILFSFMFLGEKAGWFDFVCLFACFVGAILIVKPDFIFHSHHSKINHRLYIFGLVFIAALLKGFEDVIVREAGTEVNFLAVPFLYGLIGMLLFPIPMVIMDKKYPSFTFMEVIVVFLIALCTFAYQAFMALGLQFENAGRVSMVNYFQVAFMYISDITIFHREFQILDFLGTLMIFGFNIINGVLKCRKRYQDLTLLREGNIEKNNDVNQVKN